MDVGGSHVTAGLVECSDTARVMPGSTLRTPADEGWPAPALLDAWATTGSDCARRFGSRADDLDSNGADRSGLDLHGVDPDVRNAPRHIGAVGIAMPAPFDYGAGISTMRHKFAALSGRNVGQGLRSRWNADASLGGLLIRFGNDGDLWALGEARFGAAAGARRVIGVTIGTGLGSGFVAEGVVQRDGPGVPTDAELWCTPFDGATAEDVASGRSLVRSYVHRSSAPLAQSDASIDGQEIARRARDGDPNARGAFDELGRSLGRVLRPWSDVFEADIVVVGGSVAKAWDLFAAPLAEALPGVRVVCTQLFEDATLLGAAAMCHG